MKCDKKTSWDKLQEKLWNFLYFQALIVIVSCCELLFVHYKPFDAFQQYLFMVKQVFMEETEGFLPRALFYEVVL